MVKITIYAKDHRIFKEYMDCSETHLTTYDIQYIIENHTLRFGQLYSFNDNEEILIELESSLDYWSFISKLETFLIEELAENLR